MLRKTLLSFAPLALVAAVGSAYADDTNVTLYGVLDAGVANIQHSLNFDPNFVTAANPTVSKGTQSATGVFNGGLSASRWGIKGTEDMGDGLKALFLLESGINVGTGSVSNAGLSLARNASTGPNTGLDSAISGQLFARGAYVGLSSSSWGQLTLGRHQSFFLDNIATFDPMSGSQEFSPIGFSGSYGGGGFTDDSRVDNSLKYKITSGDFTVGALYKFGGVAGATSAQSGVEINGIYATGPLAVQLGFEQFKDAFSIGNTSAAAATGTATNGQTNNVTGAVSATAADTRAYMLSAKYTLAKTTGKIGFEREEFQNPTNATADLGVNTVFGQTISAMNVNAFPLGKKTLNVYWIGATQEFTGGWSLSGAAYHVAQNGYNCPASGTGSGCSGALNYYSLLGDYRFTKRTDMYVGAMFDRVSGGPATAVANSVASGLASETVNRIIGLGMRHVF